MKRKAVRTFALSLVLAASMGLSGCSYEEISQIPERIEHFIKVLTGEEKEDQGSGPEETDGTVAEGNQTEESEAGGQEAGEASSTSSQSAEELDIFAAYPEYQTNLSANSSLFRGQEGFFYYYNQISTEEQRLYDGMLQLMQDPTSIDYRIKVDMTSDPSSDAFNTVMSRAYQALMEDHPELFWCRNTDPVFNFYYPSSGMGEDYFVMIRLNYTYDNYEAEINAFNNAVDVFMQDIDLSQPAPVIALQIHDKLIDLVSYDFDLAAAQGNGFDYGYSAYGALVANSRGMANTCVCDGYSNAFEYLARQAGLTVTKVTGTAGDENGAESHSWNLVQYDDGQWYEIDTTWDDIVINYDPGESGAYIYENAMADSRYWGRVRHYLFNITSTEMNSFAPDDSYTYYMPDGSGYATFLSSSYHSRFTEADANSSGSYVAYLAPNAEGTLYTYDYITEDNDGDGWADHFDHYILP